MKLTPTSIADLVVIEPTVFEDQRGYFMESYQQAWFAAHVAPTQFIQDNESKSSRGVLRGLHFQSGAFAQAKLVRVLQGEVLDIAVDLRPDSPTFGQHLSIVLNDQNIWKIQTCCFNPDQYFVGRWNWRRQFFPMKGFNTNGVFT